MSNLHRYLDDPESDIDGLPTPTLLRLHLHAVWRVCCAESAYRRAHLDNSRGCRENRKVAAEALDRESHARGRVDKALYRRMIANWDAMIGCLRE
jgi:hypothetical protein